VFLPDTVVYCKQAVYASNRTRTESFARQRRLSGKEILMHFLQRLPGEAQEKDATNILGVEHSLTALPRFSE
jgi:hypothetical protein